VIEREKHRANSRDEVQHTERNSLLFIEKMMLMDKPMWPEMKSKEAEV